MLALSFSLVFAYGINEGNTEQDPKELKLDEVIILAQQNDPWLQGNQFSQDSLDALSISSGTLPDPKVNVAFANLPIDTFDFNQEAMTQFKVGISQMFPRGDSLKIKKLQLESMSKQFPYQRETRKAQVVTIVSQLWLDAYKIQESISLIEKDRPLFEQLADVSEAAYSSALGRTRQQDIVRAQLELTRLEDRLTILRQKQEMINEGLLGWIGNTFSKISTSIDDPSFTHFTIPSDLPHIPMLNKAFYLSSEDITPASLYEFFKKHPTVAAIDQKLEVNQIGIDLTKQKYKPEWGVNASYGYRDDDQQGKERADFFSVGVSLDVPLFTSDGQDKQVESAKFKAEAVKTEKLLMLRKMIADFEKDRAALRRLKERKHLYEKELLPQMHEQAEASLTAYTNDDGDFAEVVRARIAELNASIDALGIEVDYQKVVVRLNYYFMNDPSDIVLANNI